MKEYEGYLNGNEIDKKKKKKKIDILSRQKTTNEKRE